MKSMLTLTTLRLLTVVSLAWVFTAAAAPYPGLKPDKFMKEWLVLKPFPVSDTADAATQKKAFAQDLLLEQGGEAKVHPQPGTKVNAGGHEMEWRLVTADSDIVDLKKGDDSSDFAVAYAWAEIDMAAKTKGLLGIGSDDSVKVWVNGKLVHENWTNRATVPDQDLVPVEFERGTNHLLLKVQNAGGDWSFCCRLLGEEVQANKLITAVLTGGDSEAVEKLLAQGVGVNSHGTAGITAYQTALLRGEKDMAQLLADHGARTNDLLPPPERLTEALFRAVFSNNVPGAAVLVAQNGTVLFKKGYGLADVSHNTPIIPETKFRIGSITKQFTASAILKLQEQGKLSVSDKLSKYFPEFPRGDEVTLRHLLTHTSGIRSYTDKPGFLEKVTSPVTSDDLIKSFQNDPYDFDPGKKWHYDNSGFFLLGRIIEKVSGESYGDFLRREFFQPLGMTSTGVHRGDTMLDHEALGYQFAGADFTNAVNWDMSWAGGAGALYSTVEDLYRWNEGVFGNKLVGAASLKSAWTPVKTEENKEENSDTGYGYGWGISQLRGAQEISHGGGLNGFSSYLLRLPRENFTVAVLANSLPGTPGADPGRLAHLVVEVYLGEKLAARPSRKANPTVSGNALEAIVGRYDYGMAVMTVTKSSEHVYAQLGGQPRFEIFPKSETEFFWKVVDAQVTFVKDSQGKVIKAIHHQGGQTINAPRLEDLKEVKVATASYDALVGKYDYGQGKTIMTISHEGAGLFAQLTGQPKFEIFPKSPTEFFWKVVDAQVEFVKDVKGKVVKVVHHQGGQTFEAPRIGD